MTNSGDAAEQIVRISLEGIDYALRITGAAAKNIAAFLIAAFKSGGADGRLKLKGRERLVHMLKSGRDTKIFAVKNSDLKRFAAEAKRYGVTYCVLKEKMGAPDSTVEIMVTDADAGKISRIMDRLELAAVDLATVEPAPAEREALDRDDTDKLLDQLLDENGGPRETEFRGERRSDGVSEFSRLGAETRDTQSATTNGMSKTDDPVLDTAKEVGENPTPARTDKSPPSEPRSGTPFKSAEGTRETKRPKSVRNLPPGRRRSATVFPTSRSAQNWR